MGHLRRGGGEVFRCAVAAVALLGIGCPVLRAGTWTWTGLGADNNWSTTNNWDPAGLPSNTYSATLIFDGTRCLTPEQDAYGKFYFVGMVFTNTAGAFVLGGNTNVMGSSGFKSWQFSSSQIPFIRVLTTNVVAFAGPVLAVDGTASSPRTSLVEVADGGLLQMPTLCGSLGDVVTKRGAGLVRVCEPNDGTRYACNDTTVGPEWRVEDGVVEMGVRTNRFLFANSDSKGTNWVPASYHTKCSYNLTVGDGIGSATSAVFRLIGSAQKQLLDNNLAIAVNADGLLDWNGVQDWDTTNAPCLSVSNGLVRMGCSSLVVHNGRTLDLRGSARIEGCCTNALMFYDGATISVDGFDTGAVLAADAALEKTTANAAGVVFQVSGHTGDVAALHVTGHLGAGGADSHLVKRGAGTMAIGNLTHALRTNRVEEGTLLINGLSRCGSTVSGAQWLVASNATLGGSGIISNASVVVQGGTLDPGDAVAATLTIESDLVLTPGAALVFDLTRADPASGRIHDQLVIQKGALTGLSNAVLQIAVHDQLNVDGQTFRIICGGGDFTGQSFRAVSLTGLTGRRAEVTAGSDYVDVTIRNMLAGTSMLVF